MFNKRKVKKFFSVVCFLILLVSLTACDNLKNDVEEISVLEVAFPSDHEIISAQDFCGARLDLGMGKIKNKVLQDAIDFQILKEEQQYYDVWKEIFLQQNMNMTLEYFDEHIFPYKMEISERTIDGVPYKKIKVYIHAHIGDYYFDDIRNNYELLIKMKDGKMLSKQEDLALYPDQKYPWQKGQVTLVVRNTVLDGQLMGCEEAVQVLRKCNLNLNPSALTYNFNVMRFFLDSESIKVSSDKYFKGVVDLMSGKLETCTTLNSIIR